MIEHFRDFRDPSIKRSEFDEFITNDPRCVPKFCRENNAEKWWRETWACPSDYNFSIGISVSDYNWSDIGISNRFAELLETVGDLGRWTYAPPSVASQPTFFFDDQAVATAFKLIVLDEFNK